MFEEGSFVPQTKLQNGKSYSIITDHLGTPFEAYDEVGKKAWECTLDIYGKVLTLRGDQTFIPFRYQGQYEDIETELYYNRFRYYSPDSGVYISQDPIGLIGGIALYSYVHDVNSWIDIFGLTGQRWMDASFKRANGSVYHVNVGRTLEDGTTVLKRERLAIEDVKAKGHDVSFEGYGKESDYRSKKSIICRI